jgi:asparagine synthase (glutamine-hydrolysing)
MCGICGFIDPSGQSDLGVLNAMVATLRHRGPDDQGCEVHPFDHGVVGLGHARLSILDLSPAGHQPMHFEELSIVLNGEVYNFRELRRELAGLGHRFVSESDTEVILHAFREWGRAALRRFIGMFAFVILNRDTREVILARDRSGTKPLFTYRRNGLFLFASELKAFHRHPGFMKRLDEHAVREYMDYGFVPSPHCVFEDCQKLDPGHLLTWTIDTGEMTITKYWDVREYYMLPNLELPYEEAKAQVESLLRSAFEYRMVSDVPVGVFLSGGYDSTAVAALLQSSRTAKLKTFTIGSDSLRNEAPFAREVAQHLGTDHTEYVCTTREAQDIIPTLPYFYDEPFADDSAIPTILVSRIARKSVTVALSADAGDEIFAGYANYTTFRNNLAMIDRIPGPLRGVARSAASFGASLTRNDMLRHKMDTLTEVLGVDNARMPQSLLRSYVTLNRRVRDRLFRNRPQIPMRSVYDDDFSRVKDRLSIALATDYVLYLQNCILAKVDRATMSVSLEGREPFLDHRIIELVAQLPSRYKYGPPPKRLLKDIVHTFVPQSIMDRPKTGFTVPVIAWLQSDMAYLLEDHLRPDRIAEAGVFAPDYVAELKRRFFASQLPDPSIVWKLLQFQMWYDRWMR